MDITKMPLIEIIKRLDMLETGFTNGSIEEYNALIDEIVRRFPPLKEKQRFKKRNRNLYEKKSILDLESKGE